MRRGIFIILLSIASHLIFAQEAHQDTASGYDCGKKLERADFLFRSGFFNDCIRILEGSLNTCTFSKSEREKALGLLAKSYLETDEPEKADAMVYLMLKNSPHYELKETENYESFNRLVKKYDIHPRFSIGARNVANWLNHKTTKVYSVLDGLDYSQPIPKGDYWFMYYGIAEYEFLKSLSINAEGGFFWSSYSRNLSREPSFNLNFFEKDLFVETFLYLKKYFPAGKNLLPYASAGIGCIYLYKALGSAEISYTQNDIITGKNIDFNSSLNDIQLMEMRNRNLWSWNAGAGIGYKMKNLRLFLDARYLGGLRSITRAEDRLSNQVLINDFFYVDNSMTINQFELGASIYYTLFNSVKRIRR